MTQYTDLTNAFFALKMTRSYSVHP